MNLTVVPARSLTSEQVRLWSELQETNSALSSPFLCPDFTMAVAAVRDDVHVGILEEGGRAVGFFPYQRDRFAIGHPVGGCLNYLQGVIVQPGLEWDGLQLIRGCGLVAWKFSRLLASQKPLEPFHVGLDTSMLIDLSNGYDAYVAEKRHIVGLDRLARKARKLEREVGPLRFELHGADANILETLMKWTFERYARRGYSDVFAMSWARRIIRDVHATQTPRFGGMLSVLYAGEEVAAAHMGLRSQDVWHSWFIAYAPRFARYSPGLILYLKMAQHASIAGLRTIELGGGDYPYKRALMNRSITVAEGGVDRLPLIGAARRWQYSSANLIHRSPLLRPTARTILRACRGIKRVLLYEHFNYNSHERHLGSPAQD